ncbi:SRPBCC family protein [Mycolicibacterium wolinskyi]|uniref:Vanillate O-demethylase oxidoreductase VanB n=1 Tax=Mycolicibacterium wolinskyi TaxID=59750 RepID=A0A1X2F8P9_9MYCO|nr:MULTISPECIES: SRPBCC family protein [Mycolicibacterium]MCV7286474.1 SRPBCC family protein [Mycolicibacterium wolinskyi]MCV7293454.1 SRPBCC family protein [Mycolicibacterium goodii]ORX14795.1 vanillate O-demethylase oxidoreductase VanB [Mycolicibacterium wolinskyi]
MSTDRIEKEVLLRAPLDRVWRAISDADEFGRWFGVRFDGPFVAGTSVTGVITPTEVDEEVAAMQEPYTGQADTWQIVAVEAPHRLAFRWHPYAVDQDSDYSAEPTTLVEFSLSEAADGVLLRIVESGFDAIPAERRASAFEANSDGWAHQTELVRKYLALHESV